RELFAGYSAKSVVRPRDRFNNNSGIYDRHQRERGRDRALQSLGGCPAVPHRHLPHGILRWAGWTLHHLSFTVESVATGPAAVPQRRFHRTNRLRQLGGVGVVGGPEHS